MIENELQIGEYIIPEGCTIKRVGNIIQVYQKKKDRLEMCDFRCKDCKHYVGGHTGLYYWTTMVCDMKPKTLSHTMEKRKEQHKDFQYYKLYYSAQKYGKPCEHFEPKEQ